MTSPDPVRVDARLGTLLDCSSIETARASLAHLLGANEHELRGHLRSISIPESHEPVSALAIALAGSEEALPDPDAVRWFHATRVTDSGCFARAGVLTKAAVTSRLRPLLEELAHGLSPRGIYPNAGSVAAKQSVNDEGPFAFLIRTSAASAPGSIHAYTEAPELVEDLAGEMLGENYGLLVDRFRTRSAPCLVHFRARGTRHHVARTLWYVYLVEHGCPEIDAASAAGTCYDGGGMAVPASDILEVERL